MWMYSLVPDVSVLSCQLLTIGFDVDHVWFSWYSMLLAMPGLWVQFPLVTIMKIYALTTVSHSGYVHMFNY